MISTEMSEKRMGNRVYVFPINCITFSDYGHKDGTETRFLKFLLLEMGMMNMPLQLLKKMPSRSKLRC